MTTAVLDITTMPEYWDEIAKQKDAGALRLKQEADDARATAFALRAKRDKEQPSASPRGPVNRREAAHKRLLGLDPYDTSAKKH
jgi:hypothetical protein